MFEVKFFSSYSSLNVTHKDRSVCGRDQLWCTMVSASVGGGEEDLFLWGGGRRAALGEVLTADSPYVQSRTLLILLMEDWWNFL